MCYSAFSMFSLSVCVCLRCCVSVTRCFLLRWNDSLSNLKDTTNWKCVRIMVEEEKKAPKWSDKSTQTQWHNDCHTRWTLEFGSVENLIEPQVSLCWCVFILRQKNFINIFSCVLFCRFLRLVLVWCLKQTYTHTHTHAPMHTRSYK